MSEATNEKVCIAVLPIERMSKVVRLATSAVASRTGLNLAQADDINTAIDELFKMSVSSGGVDRSFCINYDIRPDRLEITAEGVDTSFCDETSKVNRYRRFIIDKVADRFEESLNPDGGYDVLLVKYVTQ